MMSQVIGRSRFKEIVACLAAARYAQEYAQKATLKGVARIGRTQQNINDVLSHFVSYRNTATTLARLFVSLHIHITYSQIESS